MIRTRAIYLFGGEVVNKNTYLKRVTEISSGCPSNIASRSYDRSSGEVTERTEDKTMVNKTNLYETTLDRLVEMARGDKWALERLEKALKEAVAETSNEIFKLKQEAFKAKV